VLVAGRRAAFLRLLLALPLLDEAWPGWRLGLPLQRLGVMQQRPAVGLERKYGRQPSCVRRFVSFGPRIQPVRMMRNSWRGRTVPHAMRAGNVC
jgi:hypothetical protein